VSVTGFAVRDKVNFQMLGEGNAYNTGDFSGGA
jgi:hypothetical protein